VDAIAERLQRVGFGILSIDLRGHGESRSDRLDWATLSSGEKKATWACARRDVDAAARWLLSQPSIHSTSLNRVGVRAGSALVARHARDDEKVLSVALVAPSASEYGYDVKADIQTLQGLPTFVVSAKNDEAERLAQEANASYSSTYVDVFVVTPRDDDLLGAKNLAPQLAKWMIEKAMPKKAAGRRR
jgi:dienelactone hydrolase